MSKETRRRDRFFRDLTLTDGWSKKYRYRDVMDLSTEESILLSNNKPRSRAKWWQYLDASGITWAEYVSAVQRFGYDKVLVRLDIFAYDMSKTKKYLDQWLPILRKSGVPTGRVLVTFVEGLKTNKPGSGYLINQGERVALQSDLYFEAIQLVGYESFMDMKKEGLSPEQIIDRPSHME